MIIGAGPAGLAVGACLRRAGRDFVIVDKAAELASAWRHHYERLHLHTVRRQSALPYRPLPREWPRYVPRAQVVEYLDDYARAFELAPRFSELVTRVVRDGEGWRVDTASASYQVANVVVASGYNAVPYRPAFTGTFGGPILHSAEYRNARAYKGQRVLVVGAGNTGAEIALDLCEQGALPDISIRGPIHVVRRDPFGIPAQILAIATDWIPRAIRDPMFDLLVRMTVGDLTKSGIRKAADGIVYAIEERGRIPLIDVGTVDMIRAGKIAVRPDIRALDDTGATFVDGERSDYAAIVLATGYRPALEAFLADAAQVVDARGYPRSWRSELPGLYFVGFCSPVTGQLREIAREARRVAAAIAAP